MKIYIFFLIALFATTIICKAEQRKYYNETDTCYMEIDYNAGSYTICKKGNDSFHVADLIEIITLSTGKVKFSQDTLYCIEKNNYKTYLFHIVNEYMIKPIQTPYFKKNLYVHWIKKDNNTAKSLSWQDGKLDGWMHIMDPAKGVKSIQYQDGVPIDTIFMPTTKEKPVWQAFPSPSNH